MGLSDYRKYGSTAGKLADAIANDRVSHAYILEGDSTIDKLGLAKAFVKALLCPEAPGEGCGLCRTCRSIDDGNYEDLYLIRPQGNEEKTTLSIRVNDVEELVRNLQMKATGGDRNIAIIEGADYMVDQAQNKILKTLEEPKAGTLLLILSENSNNLLATINSRCIRFRLMRNDLSGDNDMLTFAENYMDMIAGKAYFADIVKTLDQEIGDRLTAYQFLDALEAVLAEAIRHGSDFFSRSHLIYGVECTEKARSNIKKNMQFKYAIRQLTCKLEEYEW